MVRTAIPSRSKRGQSANHGKSKRTSSPSDNGAPTSAQRLHKVLANAGVASRRACESLIVDGRVRVNGQPVSVLPTMVDPESDRIEVDGRVVIQARNPKHSNKYVIINKPRGVVSTCRDPEGRRCVTDLVQFPTRLFPVGRLDADSSGLILLTNDGLLASRLTHPRYEVPKHYQISVRGQVEQSHLQELRKGIHLAHRQASGGSDAISVKQASAAQVKLIGYSRDRTHGMRTNLLITLRDGQNRQIRRMLSRVGFKVRRLQRVSIGPVTNKGLAIGQWRPLTTREVNTLRRAAGMAH